MELTTKYFGVSGLSVKASGRLDLDSAVEYGYPFPVLTLPTGNDPSPDRSVSGYPDSFPVNQNTPARNCYTCLLYIPVYNTRYQVL